MKIDLHVHTTFSPDSSISPKALPRIARRVGLDGVAITDHNSVRARRLGRMPGMVVIYGVEVSTSAGHIIVYGAEEEIPRGISPEELLDYCREHALPAVAPHPYRISTGIGHLAFELTFTAVETLNGGSPEWQNRRAQRRADALGLPCTGGSDAHRPCEVGRAYTVVEGDDPLDAILKGRVRPAGRGLTLMSSLKKGMKTTFEWAARGFKHI